MRTLLVLLLLSPTLAFAAPANKAFQSEFAANLQDVEDKIERLADAIPADKYGWRPAAGVRSIGEVYAHVAGSNYFLMTFVGQEPPKDIPADIEKITDKAKIVAELKRSFDHVRAAAKSMSEADLDKPVNMFGQNTTQRGVLVTILSHVHEHLGQSIAYARINNITPPWSKE